MKKINPTPAICCKVNLQSQIPGSSSISVPVHCTPNTCNINVGKITPLPGVLQKHSLLKEHRGASGRFSPPQDVLPPLVFLGSMHGEWRNMVITEE